MKYYKVSLVVLIAFVILLNIRIESKVNRLESKINSLQIENSNLQSNLSSIPNQVNQVLNDIKEVESWISPIKIDTETSNGKNLKLKASWQIKDFTKGSTVYFHYRKEGNEFSVIEATNKGEGFFETTIPTDIKIVPLVYVQRSESQAQGSRSVSVRTSSPEKLVETNNLAYYVSVENKDTIKSSEMENRYLNGISNRIYGNLIVGLFISDGKFFNVSLNDSVKEEAEVGIKHVTLKAYNNRKLMSTSDFEHEKYSGGYHNSYHVTINRDNQLFDRLVVVITFDDGTVYEKEVYKEL